MTVNNQYCGCGHHADHHTEDGCIYGWSWNADGLVVAEGCKCEWRPPQ